MRVLRSIWANALVRWHGVTAAAALLACGACSFLLDSSTSQCTTDADCNHFGFLPYCENSVCVPSGLGPLGECYHGDASQPDQFLNACSDGYLPSPTGGTCVTFDDCARLGICSDAGDAGPPLDIPPPPAKGAAPSDAGPSVPGTPRCSTMANGAEGLVYITGSSNFPNVLKKIAPIIINGTAANLEPGPTPIFLTTNSCTAVKSIFSSKESDHVLANPGGDNTAKYAQYYDGNGNANPCILDEGTVADIGESDVYSTTCNAEYVVGSPYVSGGNVIETIGPVQAMAFVVPSYSLETSISREAAREVFGMGGNRGATTPWIDPSYYFVRNKNTGTQQMIGLDIGVDAAAFWGSDQGSADGVHTALVNVNNATEADKSIGIISVDVSDSDPTNLRVLAYKEEGQDCAYLPDSTSTNHDKQNVRDGHYPIWGPLHFFRANPSPNATYPNASGDFLNYVSGLNNVKAVLDAFISASLIPSCAMAVQRVQGVELGPLSAVPPGDQSCACYFESQPIAAGHPPSRGCSACNDNDDCPSDRFCSVLKYCELSGPAP
jgi:hypothetical protein